MVSHDSRFSTLIERILGGVFLAGFSSFLFFGSAGIASAAVNPPRAPTSTVILSEQSVSYTWNTSTFGGTETFWVVRRSLGGTATPVTVQSITPTSTLTYTFTGLATNTAYTFGVAGSDASASSTVVTSSLVYTAAAVPNAPTLSTVGQQTLRITMATDTNPSANTTFIVRDTNANVGTKYLQSNATWGSATATLTWHQLGGGSATTTIGLATSTSHTISIAAVNGDSTNTTTYSSSVTLSTLAAAPVAPAVATSTLATTLAITINTTTLNSNPTSTASFIVRDTASGTLFLQTNGTWGSATATLTWAQLGFGSATTTTGLTANTNHIIAVAAVNQDSAATTTYGATATSYTLATVPTLSFTNDNQARTITVTLVSDGANYIENTTLSTNSGSNTSTTFISTSLTCNASYGFRAYSTNWEGAPSAFSATSTQTLTCIPAGGSTPPPVVPPAVTPPVATPAATTTPGATVVTPPVSGQTPAVVTLPAQASPVAVSRQLDKVARFNFKTPLKSGSTGANVQQLQTLLKELGFFTYPRITNNFGPVTRAAVVAYQKANDLTATGQLDAATRAALQEEERNQTAAPAPSASSGFKFSRNLGMGSSGAEVRQLQQVLKDLGFFTYPSITGIFGPVTRDAVVRFQRDRGLAPFPGVVGPGTRAALNSL